MSLIFARERLEPIIPELQDTFIEHWQELAEDKDLVPLDPDYDRYIDMDNNGNLFFFSCRKDGELIGYFVGIVCRGLHYATTIDCRLDIFYIRKEHRGSSLGIKLFKAAEKELRALGVDRWYVGCKVKHDTSALFERLGFRPIETFFSKMLD